MDFLVALSFILAAAAVIFWITKLANGSVWRWIVNEDLKEY